MNHSEVHHTSRRNLIKGIGAMGVLGALGSNTQAAPPSSSKLNLNKKGSVVLFQGDSITDDGRKKDIQEANNNKALGRGYVSHLAAHLLLTYPDQDLQIYNRGISGNKIPDLAARWQEDAIDLKPDVVSILVGINDLWHTVAFGSKYKGTIDDYEEGYRQLLRRTQDEVPGVQIVLCEPFTLRDWEAFDPYRVRAKKIADEFNLIWVPFQSAFDKAAKAAPTDFWLWDGIHATDAGKVVMAQTWCEAVGI